MMPVSVWVPARPESGNLVVVIGCAESDSCTKPSTNPEYNDVDYAAGACKLDRVSRIALTRIQ